MSYMILARLLMLGFIIVLMNGFFRGTRGWSDYRELMERKVVLAGAVERLRLENEELAIEIQRIQKSPAYANKVLRDKYHIMDSGEKMVFFED